MSATSARETRSQTRRPRPSLSILLTSADCAEDLERTLLSLARLPQIDSAELLVGLHGEDGLGSTRSLVERHLPLVPTRVESFPLADAGVARAAMYGLSEAPLVAILEEGSAIDDELLERASAALDADRSLVAARAAAEPGVEEEIVVLRRNDEIALESDPLAFVQEEQARVALVPRAEPEPESPREFPQLQPPARVRALLVVNVCAAAFYLSWWLRPGHVGVPALFAALALAEAFNLLHLLGLWWSVWTTRAKPPPRSTRAWSIDVFVTTCGEPLYVVRRTVAAAVGMEGAHRTYVLDDAGRDDVRALAKALGAEYIRRGTRKGAKAGNLNHALTVTTGELVAVFDADHVPDTDFLDRLVGYFEDADLAFVQTPQFYRNSRHNLVARGAYQQQTIFYGPICRGKNGANAAFCCGTNVVFRREALAAVGGFDERSVVEDFVTSMRLHRHGWRSVYYPFIVSEGLGPETLGAYFAQQFRWARGSVGALVSLEPFRRGYTLAQRLQYLLASTFYLMGLVTSVYVALPILYLLAGWSAFSSSSADFVLYYAPYLVLGLITVRWGLGGRLRLDHLRYTFGAFPVYVAAAVAAFARLPSRFRATGARSGGGRMPVYARVTVIVFFLTQVAIVAGLFLRPLDARTFTNVSWAVVNLLLLSGIALVALRPLRVETGEAAAIRAASGALPETALTRVGTTTLARVRTVDASVLRIAALTGFAFALRLGLAGVQSLRLDESLSLKEAKLPLGTMVGNLFRWDVHPPLYYTFLHAWVWLTGTGVVALRIPSVIFGTAAVPLLYVVARRFTNERGATYAAAIGAASPFWIWHSDEARMYTLLLVLALAALWRLFVAYERNRPQDWVIYALVLGASLYSHYFAILMLPVQAVWLLLQRPPRAMVLRRWLPAVAGAVLLLVVWLAALVVHDGLGGVAAINTGVRESPLAFGFLSGFYTFSLFLLVYVLGYGQIGEGAGILGLAAAVLAGGWPLVAVLTVVSGRVGRWLRSREAAVLGFWIAFSLVTVYVLNIWKGNVWMQRYLIAVSPALFILLGAALARVIRPIVLGTALIVAVLTVATVVDTRSRNNMASEDWRGVATVLDRSARPGDAVAVVPWFYVTPLDYYFDGAQPVRGALLTGQTPRAALLSTLTGLARAHRGHDLWVATAYEGVFDPQGIIRRGLAHRFGLLGQYHLPGQVVLRRYSIPRIGPPALTLGG